MKVQGRILRRVLIVWVQLAVSGWLQAAPSDPGPGFSATVTRDRETGWELIGLARRDPASPETDLEAWIAPAAGSNLYSIRFGGMEILHQARKLKQLPGVRFGVPVLYPTPNRIRKGEFRFEGKTFAFGKPGSKRNFIHGLVRSLEWSYDPPVVKAGGASVRTYLDIRPGHPVYGKFPFKHCLSVTYTLERDAVRVAFAVENRDTKRLPFGFGLHPYFRYLGERADTRLCVPARRHMEATPELLPTGVLEELKGTRFDLREGRSLEGVELDDVYWGMRPAAPAWYESATAGIRVTLEASKAFTHLVVYTPPGRPFFCVENQTCSTDAHNLHARGLKKEAHLLIAPPGKTVKGWVRYRLRRTK